MLLGAGLVSRKESPDFAEPTTKTVPFGRSLNGPGLDESSFCLAFPLRSAHAQLCTLSASTLGGDGSAAVFSSVSLNTGSAVVWESGLGCCKCGSPVGKGRCSGESVQGKPNFTCPCHVYCVLVTQLVKELLCVWGLHTNTEVF